MVRLGIEQLAGNTREFLKFWEPREPVTATAAETTIMVEVSSTGY